VDIGTIRTQLTDLAGAFPIEALIACANDAETGGGELAAAWQGSSASESAGIVSDVRAAVALIREATAQSGAASEVLAAVAVAL
jgi:hypothetical protein